jgi:exodeoxyribonuclease-3
MSVCRSFSAGSTDTEVDVVCFQETKTVDENFPLDDLNNAGYEAAFMGQKSYNGVAIISRFPIEEVQKELSRRR